jgi:hypothetical protein
MACPSLRATLHPVTAVYKRTTEGGQGFFFGGGGLFAFLPLTFTLGFSLLLWTFWCGKLLEGKRIAKGKLLKGKEWLKRG